MLSQPLLPWALRRWCDVASVSWIHNSGGPRESQRVPNLSRPACALTGAWEFHTHSVVSVSCNSMPGRGPNGAASSNKSI